MVEIIAAIIGAVVTLVASLLYWRWTKERRVVQVAVWSSPPTTLKDGTYRSQTVRYENVGNRAVKALEIDVQLKEGARIEKVVHDQLIPVCVPASDTRVVATVPLLNPREATQILLTTTDAVVKATARAEDVEVRSAADAKASVVPKVLGFGVVTLIVIAVVKEGLEATGLIPKSKTDEEVLVDRLDSRLEKILNRLESIDGKLPEQPTLPTTK